MESYDFIAILCVSTLIGALALDCSKNVGPLNEDYIKDPEVTRAALNFLIDYGKNHQKSNITLTRKQFLESIKDYHFKDDRVRHVICVLVNLGSTNGWFSCIACRSVVGAAKLLAGGDGTKMVNGLKAFLELACKYVSWLMGNVCGKKKLLAELALVKIKMIIHRDGGVINTWNICAGVGYC